MIPLAFLMSTVTGAAVLLIAILAADVSELLENRRRNQLLREKGLLPRKTKHVPAKNVKFTPKNGVGTNNDKIS